MDPLEFCLANHINGDSSLTLRFYVFCQKAMCEHVMTAKKTLVSNDRI